MNEITSVSSEQLDDVWNDWHKMTGITAIAAAITILAIGIFSGSVFAPVGLSLFCFALYYFSPPIPKITELAEQAGILQCDRDACQEKMSGIQSDYLTLQDMARNLQDRIQTLQQENKIYANQCHDEKDSAIQELKETFESERQKRRTENENATQELNTLKEALEITKQQLQEFQKKTKKSNNDWDSFTNS